MPIHDNASYVPTINEFLPHWGDVNAALPLAKPLVLKTGLARAGLVGLRDALQTQLDLVQEELNDQEIAAEALKQKRQVLLARLNEFNGVIDAFYEGTTLQAARPLAPGIGEGEEKFTEPLRDMKSLWAKLNALPAPSGVTLPLELDGDFDLADFTALMGELRTAFEAVGLAEQDLRLEKLTRDAKFKVIYESLRLYRLAVPARLPNNEVLLASLPRLSPEPGSTPAAVDASAVFQAPDQFKVVYDASDAADLKEYQLRGNAGATFRSEDAVVIATNAKDATREFVSGFGLTQPGASVGVRVCDHKRGQSEGERADDNHASGLRKGGLGPTGFASWRGAKPVLHLTHSANSVTNPAIQNAIHAKEIDARVRAGAGVEAHRQC
jgi:hypothetical protein